MSEEKKKKSLLMRLIGIFAIFLVGFVAALGVVKIFMPGMMIHEAQSPYDFDKTVETIKENADKLGWKLPKIHDMQETLTKFDQGDIGKMVVIELCKPKYAYSLLKNEEARYIGVMMPCAIAVYKKADGKTYVGSMNLGIMGKMFGGKINEAMTNASADDEIILKFLSE